MSNHAGLNTGGSRLPLGFGKHRMHNLNRTVAASDAGPTRPQLPSVTLFQ
eukprot:COSAG01_NODE_42433_length_440_cov_0.750733_2_plen_49_part_01